MYFVNFPLKINRLWNLNSYLIGKFEKDNQSLHEIIYQTTITIFGLWQKNITSDTKKFNE